MAGWIWIQEEYISIDDPAKTFMFALDNLGHIGVLGGFFTLDEKEGITGQGWISASYRETRQLLLFFTFVIMLWR